MHLPEMKDLYSIPDIVETVYDSAHATIRVSWKTFSGHQHLRPSIEAQVACVEQGAKHVIVDTSEAKGLPSDEDQAWFATEVFPRYEKAGLKTLVTVLPKSAVTKLGASRWSETGNRFGFKTFTCASLEDAQSLCAGEMA